MTPTIAKPLLAAIGERMRALRKDRGLRQDDVAQAARGLGFRWDRTTVAKLEAGQRHLGAAEFLFLADMVNFAALNAPPERRRAVVELADLFPGTGWVTLTIENRTQARALQMFVRGQLAAVNARDLDVPALRNVRTRGEQALATLHATLTEREPIWQAVWPEATDLDVLEAVREGAGEAEQKAARGLGVPAFAIALEARRRWQRSLSAERDRRMAAQALDEAAPRTAQAVRGHITRLLLVELQDLPAQLREARIVPTQRSRPRASRGSPARTRSGKRS